MGKNKLLRLMRENNLLAVIRRKKPTWQKALSESYISKNILQRQFLTNAAKKKLAIDITYIPIPNSMVYMAAVLDLFNNEILGYQLSVKPNAILSTKLIRKLTANYPLKGSLIHSDQGIHFTNKEYVKLLQSYGIIQSMSRRGNCWDNAVIESFFGHFKSECIKLKKRALKRYEDVAEIVEEYITYYNNRRPQLRLDGLSPVRYRLKHEKI
jgi:Transposase and inactivated derivatives